MRVEVECWLGIDRSVDPRSDLPIWMAGHLSCTFETLEEGQNSQKDGLDDFLPASLVKFLLIYRGSWRH